MLIQVLDIYYINTTIPKVSCIHIIYSPFNGFFLMQIKRTSLVERKQIHTSITYTQDQHKGTKPKYNEKK